MPDRVQLRRTKGWRKPPGAVVVSRPSRWGNPYRIVPSGGDLLILVGRRSVTAERVAGTDAAAWRVARACAVRWYRAWLAEHPEVAAAARRELARRDLCCWCPPDSECHADVLLTVANAAVNESSEGDVHVP